MPENPQAKMWFWIGVSSITVIIFVLWAWATKISFSTFSWKKTPEAKLIEKSKENWRAVFDAQETARQSEQIKSQLKKIINKISAETDSTSSTVANSSTILTASSTLINSTTPTP